MHRADNTKIGRPKAKCLHINKAHFSLFCNNKPYASYTAMASPASRLSLSSVIGHTVTRHGQLSCITLSSENSNANESDLIVSYIAASTVVLYSSSKHQQRFIHVKDGHQWNCVESVLVPGSKNHALIAVGDRGKRPTISVYRMPIELIFRETVIAPAIIELPGHAFGTQKIVFDSHARMIAVLGTEHNSSVAVFRIEDGAKVFTYNEKSIDTGHEVNSADNSADNRNFQFNIMAIDFHDDSHSIITAGDRHLTVHNLESKISVDARLGVHKEECFVCVRSGRGSVNGRIFALTQKGVLCTFRRKKDECHDLDKWVDLRLEIGYSLSMNNSGTIIAISGGDSKIRLFNPGDLAHIATLPKPQALKQISMRAADEILNIHTQTSKTAACISSVLDAGGTKCITVYEDRTMFIWDIFSVPQRPVQVLRSFFNHSDTINDVKFITNRTVRSKESKITPKSFVTCSSDSTVRLWNSADQTSEPFRETMASQQIVSMSIESAKNDCNLKCLSVIDGDPNSPQLLIATGDKSGNVRIHDLFTRRQIAFFAAHDKEVRSMDYSSAKNWLCSGSRDSLIHIYDLHSQGTVKTMPPAHSAAVNGVCFLAGGHKLVSCSSDKSIIMRSLKNDGSAVTPETVLQTRATLHCISAHPGGRFAVTVSADKSIRVLDASNDKQLRMYKFACRDSEPSLVACDPSGLYLAVASSDKYLHILDFFSGQCLSHVHVFCLSMSFNDDSSELVTVAETAIHCWRISDSLARKAREKVLSIALPSNRASKKPRKTALDFLDDDLSIDFDEPDVLAVVEPNSLQSRLQRLQTKHEDSMDSQCETSNVQTTSMLSESLRPTSSISPVKSNRKPGGLLPSWAELTSAGAALNADLNSVMDPLRAISVRNKWAERVQKPFTIISDLTQKGVEVRPPGSQSPMSSSRGLLGALAEHDEVQLGDELADVSQSPSSQKQRNINTLRDSITADFWKQLRDKPTYTRPIAIELPDSPGDSDTTPSSNSGALLEGSSFDIDSLPSALNTGIFSNLNRTHSENLEIDAVRQRIIGLGIIEPASDEQVEHLAIVTVQKVLQQAQDEVENERRHALEKENLLNITPLKKDDQNIAETSVQKNGNEKNSFAVSDTLPGHSEVCTSVLAVHSDETTGCTALKPLIANSPHSKQDFKSDDEFARSILPSATSLMKKLGGVQESLLMSLSVFQKLQHAQRHLTVSIQPLDERSQAVASDSSSSNLVAVDVKADHTHESIYSSEETAQISQLTIEYEQQLLAIRDMIDNVLPASASSTISRSSQPHSYSEFTGATLRNSAITTPNARVGNTTKLCTSVDLQYSLEHYSELLVDQVLKKLEQRSFVADKT